MCAGSAAMMLDPMSSVSHCRCQSLSRARNIDLPCRCLAADARLRVRSYGPPLESFRVRLPPGMELISTTSGGGYSLAVIDPETADNRPKNAAQEQQLVEVRFEKPAASAEVLLRAQR